MMKRWTALESRISLAFIIVLLLSNDLPPSHTDAGLRVASDVALCEPVELRIDFQGYSATQGWVVSKFATLMK